MDEHTHPGQTADSKRPKYAPANEAGEKPYVVAISEWGRIRERIYYAAKSSDAVYAARGRTLHVTARARRATPDDMERLT